MIPPGKIQMKTSVPWPEPFFSHSYSILHHGDPWNWYVDLQLICLMPAYILCRQTFAIFFDLECVQWNQGVSLGGGAEKMLLASTWDQCLRPWSREKMHRVGLNLPPLSLLAPWERHHRNTPSQPCEMWGQKVVLNLAMTYFTEWRNENVGMDTMWIIQAKEMSKKDVEFETKNCSVRSRISALYRLSHCISVGNNRRLHKIRSFKESLRGRQAANLSRSWRSRIEMWE